MSGETIVKNGLLSTCLVGDTTDDYYITPEESNYLFTNDSTVVPLDFFLPSAYPGLTYTFSVAASYKLSVFPDGSDQIILAGISDLGTEIYSRTIGSNITLTAVSNTEWVITSYTGDWTLVGDPTFHVPFTSSGYKGLSSNLTINGTTVPASQVFRGEDATLSTWTAYVGDNLSIGGSGTDPVIDEYSPGVTDKRVKFTNQKYFESADTSMCQPGTDDIVIELIGKPDVVAATFLQFLGTFNGTSGWQFYQSNGTSDFVFYLSDGTTPAYLGITGSNQEGYVHIMVFVDKSGSAGAYLNGSYVNSVSVSTINSVTNSSKFQINGRPGSTNYHNGSVCYFAMWHASDWLETHLQASLAAERFYKASGIWPLVAHNTSYLNDGNMENASVIDFTTPNGALSKSTASPNTGSQSLRVSYTSVTNPFATITVSIGDTVSIIGFARGDGTSYPVLSDSGAATLWTGTTSTAWQFFSVTRTFTGTELRLYLVGNSGFVEFDDMTMTKDFRVPSVATRANISYIDKIDSSGDRILVPVGSNWLRVCEREDTNSATLVGYLPEPQHVNELLYSEDFSDTAWVKTRSSVGSNTVVAPDGETTADSIIGSSATDTHEIYQAIASTASQHIFSVWLKSANKTWAALSSPSVSNCKAYFDLSNCVVGDVGAGCTARIQNWGNGWCRCAIIYTGIAASHNHVIQAADDDLDDTYLGDDVTVDLYMWGAQHEDTGLSIPSSYIKTTAAEVTVVKDQLRYVAKENIGGEDVGQGTVLASVLCEDYSEPTAVAMCAITDGGSSSERIVLYQQSSNITYIVNLGGVQQAGISGSDFTTNEITDVKVKYGTDNFELDVDEYVIGSDTSGTVPDDLDRIDVGQDQAATGQLSGLISDFKIYNRPV